MNYYFTEESAEAVCDFYLGRQKNNGVFLQNLQHNWEKKLFSPVVAICSKQTADKLKSLSTKELLSNFNTFSKIYESAWQDPYFWTVLIFTAKR